MDWLDIALAAVISLLAVATWWFVAVRRQWDKRYERWVKCRRCGSCEDTSDLVRRG